MGLDYPNKYPNNPYCKRPKYSCMRKWCRCLKCRQYAEEQKEKKDVVEEVEKF